MPRTKFATSKNLTVPQSWPANVIYLTSSQYSKRLSSDEIRALRSYKIASCYPLIIQPTPNSCTLVHILPITNRNHPAYKQCGLFAAQHLPADTLILPYLGLVHGPQDMKEDSDYDLSLDRELQIGVDATKMGNEARFTNDYRGIRTDGPNAEFRDCWIAVGRDQAEKVIGVYVLTAGKSGKRTKGIAKGEEILVSYGKGFWSHRTAVEDEDIP